MKEIKTLQVFLALLITGLTCNKIPKEKLTIINNFTLGQPDAYFEKQMDSLSIPHQTFLTSLLVSKSDEALKNNITMYYTNIFNISQFHKPDNENLGLLYPINLMGTQNNIGLTLLLAHTAYPNFSDKGILSYKVIRQEISEEIVRYIKSMYTSKYGTPKSEDQSSFNFFYVITGNHIQQYYDTSRVGTEIIWETEYFTASFFTGFASYLSVFDTKAGLYSDFLISYGNTSFAIKANPLRNEMQCYSYAYIQYKLKENAIKELKLDTKKL